MSYRGRFAPSPTGELHFGSLVAALGSWLDARRHGGHWLVRIEDLDTPRCVAGAAEAQLRTLECFGLLADEPVVRQSQRLERFEAALQRLLAAGAAFACRCSRSDLLGSGGVHRACVAHPSGHGTAWRLRITPQRVAFHDRCCGRLEQEVATAVGDIVLQRADGVFTYQLACVVDDAEQGITDIVRGADLLDSTPRQIVLQQRLGFAQPRYLHLPLVRDEQGRKLSKSSTARPVHNEDPLSTLNAAWRHLGQPQLAMPKHGSVTAWLRGAIEAFRVERVPASRADANAGTWGQALD